MQYTILIRKAPDGFYIASCPLIPEAQAQGETSEECIASIKEVLELCLEYRKQRGEEIPEEIGAGVPPILVPPRMRDVLPFPKVA